MSRKIVVITVIVLLLVGLSYFLYMNYKAGQDAQTKMQQAQDNLEKTKINPSQATETQSNKNATMRQVIVPLSAVNNSGESGTAIIKDNGTTVTVEVSLTKAPANSQQPIHIHKGSCPGVGVVVYPLAPLMNGKSVTTIHVTYDELLKQLPLALNVHQSQSAIQSYVACGDIKSTSVTNPTATSSSSAAQPSNSPK